MHTVVVHNRFTLLCVPSSNICFLSFFSTQNDEDRESTQPLVYQKETRTFRYGVQKHRRWPNWFYVVDGDTRGQVANGK